MNGQRYNIADFEDGGRDNKPRNMGGLEGLKKARKETLPQRLHKGTQLCHHLDFDSLKTLIGLLTHKPVRK